MYNKNKKSGLYITTIRIVAVLLIAFLLYKYFYADFRPKELWIQIQNLNSTTSIILLICSILLMPINWVFESLKWKSIISEEYQLNYWQAFKSIFRGVSLGIITPARVGEYGGRILDLPVELRKYGVLSTFICSLSQNFVNVIAGLFAMMFILNASYFNEEYSLKVFILAIVVLVLIIFVYFKLNYIIRILLKNTFIKDRVGTVILDFIDVDNVYLKWKLLMLSLMRYIVYLIQYAMILSALGINMESSLMITGIAIIFVTQTLIPLSPILQFTVRGSLAAFVLGNSLGGDVEAAVISSYAMWFINLLIPALIGAIWLLFAKLKSSTN